MKVLFILLTSIFIVTTLIGCSSGNEGEEFNKLNQNINEEMGTDVFLPQFDDLDVSFAYVSYTSDGEAESVDVQYSESVAEEVVDHMEYQNTEILYGPYNV
ncbi:hypothetical protein, partial [Pseudomonas sp. 2995-1]|uniref:hypothetical protein n=1 Tax=Pseudomonas sp. 2995-1 TaxID=1712679 RepID=UPI00117A6ABC